MILLQLHQLFTVGTNTGSNASGGTYVITVLQKNKVSVNLGLMRVITMLMVHLFTQVSNQLSLYGKEYLAQVVGMYQILKEILLTK